MKFREFETPQAQCLVTIDLHKVIAALPDVNSKGLPTNEVTFVVFANYSIPLKVSYEKFRDILKSSGIEK